LVMGHHRPLPDLLDDRDLVQAGHAMVRVAAGLFPASADVGKLPQRLVWRRRICRHAIRHLFAKAACLIAELVRHRGGLHTALGAFGVGAGLWRLALPYAFRGAHVPVAHPAHDPADRDRGPAIALLLRSRPARLSYRAHTDLFPDHAALRRMDD